MHRILSASAFLLLSLLFLIPHSFAASYLIDGDVTDWGTINWADLNTVTLNSASANKVTGDEQWGPGVGGQPYDVEAMLFDNNASHGYFALITGFKIEGYPYSNTHFEPGDIGIDVTNTTSQVQDYHSPGSEALTTTSYEFGIDIPDAYTTGPVSADLMGVSRWRSTYYETHEDPADPWVIFSGSKVGDALFAYGDPGNGHYVYEFSFLLSDVGMKYGDTVNFHWTMECGNNYLNLPATIAHAPEPASMLLLGTGLLGIAATSRRKFKK